LALVIRYSTNNSNTMPSLLRSAAALAMAGVAVANPLPSPADSNACLAAVTGKAALGDDNIRKEHCSSFLHTVVTPSAVTVTTTITGAPAPSGSGWDSWKRDVTVCPNEVPNYASACDEGAYKSACSVWGVTGESTVTVPATTTTKTVYVNGGGNGGNGGYGNGVCTSTVAITKTGCSGGTTTATVTKTATITAAVTTVTVTAPYGGDKGPSGTTDKGPTGTCLSDAKATEFVNAFVDLLEHTSYNGTQGPPGSGYHYNVSAKYLATDFQDFSDSINYMAGFPLGGVTFGSRAAFDYGQGVLQPELKVSTKFISHNCKEITWKWVAIPPTGASVMGINHMYINDNLTQIQVNHAEFDNANWINSFNIPGNTCKIPSSSSSTASTTT
jgi:hypothetical protein